MTSWLMTSWLHWLHDFMNLMSWLMTHTRHSPQPDSDGFGFGFGPPLTASASTQATKCRKLQAKIPRLPRRKCLKICKTVMVSWSESWSQSVIDGRTRTRTRNAWNAFNLIHAEAFHAFRAMHSEIRNQNGINWMAGWTRLDTWDTLGFWV